MKTKYLLFLIPCLFFASCNKDNEEDIVEKWKLLEVYRYTHTYDESPLLEIIDYSEKNITYDFRSNNRLVVSGDVPDDLFIFDDFQKGKHYYEYKKRERCITCAPPTTPNLLIDKSKSDQLDACYFCYVNDDNTMEIFSIRTNSDCYQYVKKFIKIK